jgi:hypothetical protein
LQQEEKLELVGTLISSLCPSKSILVHHRKTIAHKEPNPAKATRSNCMQHNTEVYIHNAYYYTPHMTCIIIFYETDFIRDISITKPTTYSVAVKYFNNSWNIKKSAKKKLSIVSNI